MDDRLLLAEGVVNNSIVSKAMAASPCYIKSLSKVSPGAQKLSGKILLVPPANRLRL